MGRFPPLLVGALSALHILGATAQAPQPPPTPQASGCILACTNQLKAKFQDFNCKNADDAGCLCKNQNFGFGLLCGPSSCAVQRSDPGKGRTGIIPVAPSDECSTFRDPHLHSRRARHNTAVVNKLSGPCRDGHCPRFVHLCDVCFLRNIRFPDQHHHSTVVGIGLGVGGAVIALASIGVGLLLRGRKRKPRPSMEISKPLPGSGRTYGGRGANSFEKYGNDIEMTTNRYEDMVPRQQPRTMV
ncbi:hypothetical protein CDD83_49 [Cordyceps sp. RAO-2017]|nr:hypothetical protein CDD83_49 [Cordyceps sp. RAO-2017]